MSQPEPLTEQQLDEIAAALPALAVAQQSECTCDPAPHREEGGTYSHWAGCPVADAEQLADDPVLPPAADRAAVLREAADRIEVLTNEAYERALSEDEIGYANGLENAMKELRRLAAGERDEQQAQQECPLCSHLTCVGGKPCGVISTERGDLAEPCGCTGAEAQPPRHRWFVETRDGLADQWAPGTRYVDRRLALGRYAALNENHPTWKDGTPVERRIVRETTTFTVEQPAAAPVAGQPPADTGEEARPRFVRVCIACPECDHTLDENGACANGCHVPPAVVAEPGKESSRG